MQSNTATEKPPVAKAYNGKDRNDLIFGWNPQAKLWNGRFAMVGFLAYLLWDLGGYLDGSTNIVVSVRIMSDFLK